jgi:hypothetical protein
MAEERTPRDVQERDSDVRPSDSWKPASVIPDPEPQDGWVFRWVRTSILGQTDATHTSRMFREGWEPVRSEDHPELMLESDMGSKFKGNIEVGGLLLCKAPEGKMRARSEHFQKVADNQMESVDNNYLRENDPRMPLLDPERSTRTTFGRN